MSNKADKFRNMMISPSGSTERKHEMLNQVMTDTAPIEEKAEAETEKETEKEKRRKATFDLREDLHRWLKVYAAQTDRKMVEVIEEMILEHRDKVEK